MGRLKPPFTERKEDKMEIFLSDLLKEEGRESRVNFTMLSKKEKRLKG